jgi:ubiquitin carboxyl-terminal hydrolase 10
MLIYLATTQPDFMLAPSRPSLTASTPTITFRITSTTPQSVIDSRQVYSGPHDVMADGDDNKAAGKRVKGKERKQDQQMVFERKLAKDKKEGSEGIKLVFGSTLEHEVKEVAKLEPPNPIEAKEKLEKVQQVAEISGQVPGPAKKQAAPTEPAKTETPTPASPVPAPPAPPAAKPAPKSWAALLRPAGTSPQTTSSTPGGSAIPSGAASPSSPAGSVAPLPAIAQSSSPSASGASTAPATPGGPPARGPGGYAAAASIGAASPGGYTHPPAWGAARQAEDLSKLLLEGLGPAGAAKTSRVASAPRGIINTGNMCFANSVRLRHRVVAGCRLIHFLLHQILQVLAYCTPFTNLFEELSKRVKADLGRKTPLIEAM